EPELKNRTVIIDDLCIPATDFDISTVDKDRLIASGKIAAQTYLARLAGGKVESKTIISESTLIS
ncbi:MAG: hypothetical protein ABIQ56_06805, partial [Chitinophagaceae bacterium]